MWLARLFSFARGEDAISRLAVKAAHDSHRLVWNRVSHRVLAMRLNEARGYVRARAAQCIQVEIDKVARRNPGLTDTARAELAARATDHVVGLVIRDVLVMPAQTVSKRRAA